MRVLVYLCIMISMWLPMTAMAVTVSIDSLIEVVNPPVSSQWKTECGTSTGVYTVIKQFNMVDGAVNRIHVFNIFPSAGNWFCRTNFIQVYAVGPFSSEIPVTVTVPVLSVPTLTIIP